MIKKSILTLFIALTLGALSSSAATKYEINVAGVEVTSDNKGGVTGGDIKSGTVTYDPSSNVLTLTNVTISRTGGSNYGVHNRKCDNLTIKFVGTSSITSDKANALHLDKATTVEVASGATVNLKMSNGENNGRGVVYVNGVDATFKGPGTLIVEAYHTANYKPCCFEGTGMSSKSTLTFSNINGEFRGFNGRSAYKFSKITINSGTDLKFYSWLSQRYTLEEIGALSLGGGVKCVTPAEGIFADNTIYANYCHFTDNYGVIFSTTNFPDEAFRKVLLGKCSYYTAIFDNSKYYEDEQYLTKSELQGLTSLVVSNKGISDLTGVSRLTYLKTLECDNNQLKALPTLPSALINLFCSSNQLSALPTLPASLTWLNCNYNNLTELPALPAGIQTINAVGNKFTTLYITGKSSLNKLNVRDNTSLTSLTCSNNALTNLMYSGCTSLMVLDCSSNKLTTLNDDLPATVTVFNCSSNNLTALPTLPASLNTLNCSSNQLTSLPALPAGIKRVYASSNKFTTLSLTGKSSLVSLDVSRNTALTRLSCPNNGLTSLSYSGCTSLQTLNCSTNRLTTLNALPATVTALYCDDNQLSALPTLPDGIQEIWASNNKFTSLTITGKSSLKTLNVGNNTELTRLNCPNNGLISLNYSGCTNLSELYCYSNKLTSLPTLPSTIETIDANNNNLSTLTITGKKSLKTLNVAGNTSLAYLECRLNNALTTLNCSGCTALQTIYADNNKFSTLTITGMSKLETLDVSSNKLNNLSVEGCKNLIELSIENNQIKGSAMTELINSMRTLPVGTGSWFYVLDPRKDEGNEITDAQVKAANAKNWHPMKYNKNTWVEIEVDDGVPGDVNGDGLVNGSDVTALYNYLLNNQATTGNADVNGDGNVNGSDVTALYNLLLK